jgi:hypothetical protein
MAARRNIVDRRTTGETRPFDVEELERLRTQSAAARPARAPTAPIEHEHEVLEVTLEDVDDADAPPPRPAGRAATVADPMTMSVLAEIERLDHDHDDEPAPLRRDSNLHIKPRG